ncbi:unnamed protein product [Didymodactylos carnosus]|uniref:Uncharacterized protein n=1 Tax=Didymodactylos carnosus TaxID=1234261 RepID=A0A8S2R9T0_9BILA|nr:unnamed protein product [Didymodactylos carnosus]CAF4148495.1 unnamed protein product [Didymodactylos carnosus]
MDFVKNTIEKKTGMDLDSDGRVGGATGQQLPGQHGTGAPGQHAGGLTGGLMDKAEQATRFDINNDGRIGGGQKPH